MLTAVRDGKVHGQLNEGNGASCELLVAYKFSAFCTRLSGLMFRADDRCAQMGELFRHRGQKERKKR